MPRKLNNKEIAYFDYRLFDYSDIDRMIAIRREEVAAENIDYNDFDANHGCYIYKDPELLTIKFNDDITLQGLYIHKKQMNKLVKELPDDYYEIFKMRWIEKRGWGEIAEKIGYSNRQTYYKKDYILEKYAKIQGFV